MKIPYQQLSESALNGVIDDYVLREGTDYGDAPEGHSTHSLAAKRAVVLAALRAGEAQLWFDASSETTTIRASDEPPPDGV